MNNYEKIDAVLEAQEKINEAIEILTYAELGSHVKAYIIDHLRIIASANHSFLSSDFNLDDVLAEL